MLILQAMQGHASAQQKTQGTCMTEQATSAVTADAPRCPHRGALGTIGIARKGLCMILCLQVVDSEQPCGGLVLICTLLMQENAAAVSILGSSVCTLG